MRTAGKVIVLAAIVSVLGAGPAEAKKRKGKRQIVVTNVTKELQVPAKNTASVRVPCRKKGVVGAGYHDPGGAAGITIADQGPSRNGRRWTMTLGNSGVTTRTVTVGAQCLKGKRGIKTKYSKAAGSSSGATVSRRPGKIAFARVERQVKLSAGRNIVLLECPKGFEPFSFLGAPPAFFDADANSGAGLEFERMVERESGGKIGILTHISADEERTVRALLLCWKLTGGGLFFDTHTDDDLPLSPKKKDVNMKLIDLFGEVPANGSAARAGLAAAKGSIGQTCPTDNAVVIGAIPLPPPSGELIGSRPRPDGSGWDGDLLGGESGESFGQITSCLQGGKKVKLKYRG